MDVTFASLRDLSPNVIIAVAAATASLTAALINLRIAWKREVESRLKGPRGKPRRGLLPAIAFLVVASAIGGYAFALYLMQQRESESSLLRSELRQRAEQIQSSAERIEGSRVQDRLVTLAEARLDEERRRGAEGVSAAARLAPCRAHGDAACREEDASRAAVCAALPLKGVAVEVKAYAGLATGDEASAQVVVPLGADLGTARLAPGPVERSNGSGGKLLCLDAWSWDDKHMLDLRIVVRYVLSDVAGPPAAKGSASSADAHPL